MTNQVIQTDVEPSVGFNEQAEKTSLLEILVDEKVSDNVAASYGLLAEYRERCQPRAA